MPLGEKPKMTPGRATLVLLIQRYLQGFLDPTITLLEIHKLMYFMQTNGEFLRLNFQKAYYGPYAQNLSHVLHAVEGHMLSGYADGGDDPRKEISVISGVEEEARAFLLDQKGTLERMENVSELIEGFETPFGLELLATVHWIATKEEAYNKKEIVYRFYAWGSQKNKFTLRQIEIAIDRLKDFGWI